jgi:hypothetical protein
MDDDAGALCDATLGDGSADAGGAASDEDDFVLEALHGFQFLVCDSWVLGGCGG